MTFAQELTPEQAILAYLWGESTHSYASQPAKAGESVRTVGTDPFIVGSRAKKVNRFRDIIMRLCESHPGKVRFFQYNTGGVGEIIQEIDTPSGKKKNMIRKATRVPIPLMAAIQRGDLRGTNRYELRSLGTHEIASVEGFDLTPYDPRRFYDEEQIRFFREDLVKGRRATLAATPWKFEHGDACPVRLIAVSRFFMTAGMSAAGTIPANSGNARFTCMELRNVFALES
jgi:phosphoenolpyruvate carboxykinase (ATP)